MFRALFTMLAEIIGWGRETATRHNSQPMQENAAAKVDEQLKDSAADLVRRNNLDEIRKAASE